MTATLFDAVPIATRSSAGAGPAGPPSAVTRLRRALRVVREPTSTADLVERIPGAVAALGFDRVVYARLTGELWHPSSFHGAAPVERAEWPLVLEALTPESSLLDGLGPVVVDGHGRRRLLPRSWCPSYVTVAVTDRGTIVGLIHAGRGRGRLTATDGELMSAFADAVASSFASMRALDTMREMLAAVGRAVSEIDPALPAAPAAPRLALRIAPVEPAVTAREQEVLELMAAGHTNAQIARRLVITEGTTKSHVKRIMRKLQASNRAEAVAAWIRPDDRVTCGGL